MGVAKRHIARSGRVDHRPPESLVGNPLEFTDGFVNILQGNQAQPN